MQLHSPMGLKTLTCLVTILGTMSYLFIGFLRAPARLKPDDEVLRRQRVCSRCLFATNVLTPGQYEIVVHNTTGTGRTGNIARNIWSAAELAYACKGTLQLPASDFFGAFFPSTGGRLLDFRHRVGPTHPKCVYPMRIVGNLGYFNRWNFSAAFLNSSDYVLVGDCLRQYFGFCKMNYCMATPTSHKDVLVAHVRNGDLFPSHFQPPPHVKMGQPPLSYYLSVFAYREWKKIFVIGQPTSLRNPVFEALVVLNKSGVIAADFLADHDRSWADDLRSLICADSIIMTRSSLITILPLGFSRNVFFYSCAPRLFMNRMRRVFTSQWVSPYTAMHNHTNTAEEWVEMLLKHPAAPSIVECRAQQ
jgi:hypothetical protein